MKRKIHIVSILLINIFLLSCIFSNSVYCVNQEIGNLRAFAKLYGYVRYFHPSDEASSIDWDKFAIYGVEKVKNAKNNDELKSKLEELFYPIAPTMQIYKDGEKPQPLKLPTDTSGLKIVAWQHFGLGPTNQFYGNVYHSLRTKKGKIFDSIPKIGEFFNKPIGCSLYCQIPLALYSDAKGTIGKRNDYSFDSLFSNLTKVDTAYYNGVGMVGYDISGEKYGGKEIKLKVAVKTKFEGDGNEGLLYLSGGNNSAGDSYVNYNESETIKSQKWQEYEIIGKVDKNPKNIFYGAKLIGKGKIWIDDFQLFIKNDDNKWVSVEIPNNGFEEGEIGNKPNKWRTKGEGYKYQLTSENPYKDSKCLLIENKNNNYSKMIVERLAVVIISWNVFQHFYPYMDVVKVVWDEELTSSLLETISDSTDLDCYFTLCKMTAKLQDGHINVSSTTSFQRLSHLPFLATWVENQAIIIASEDTSKFKVADIILNIDGISAEEELLNKEQYISGSPQFKRWKCVAWGFFGDGVKGSIAIIKIKRGDEIIEVFCGRNFSKTIKENKMGNIVDLGNNIYYLNVGILNPNEFISRLNDLAEAKGVIIDVRGYPHHILTEIISHLIYTTINSANWLIPQIIYPDREKMTWQKSNWQVYPAPPKFKGKIIFLTDGRAISAAETFMGIIENYKLGEIIGEPTAGTNGNLNYFTMQGGNYYICFTGMKVLKHDGSQHHLIGIQPTIPFHRTIKGVEEGRDEFIEKAIEIIKNDKKY
ncbi:MAG: S41 family peptidase [Bacteroidota bacterium]